ncbi:MAG: ATP-binding protein [Thermoplasmatota archaeon]
MEHPGKFEDGQADIGPEDRRLTGTPSSQHSIFEIDLEGNFILAPRALVDITGFSREELDLLSLHNVTFVEDREKVREAMGRIVGGEPILVTEIELFSESKGTHPIELVLLPKRDEEQITGVWGMIQDISRRRSLEEELMSARELNEASQSFLSEFVSLLTREIRQPLTSILLTLEMLDSGFFGSLNDDQKAKVDQLLDLVDKLKAMLNEALETSRNVGEEITLDRKMVSLDNLIREIVKNSDPALEEKKIRLTQNYPGERAKAVADRKAISQVVSTLMDASIAMSSDEGHIILDLERKGEWFQLSISDSGQGIPDEDLKHIFDKFHVDEEKEGRSFSEGLNLYIAKKLVESHGGRIWCESFQGLGTTFFFMIPEDKGKAED